jgi:hypothetical protein
MKTSKEAVMKKYGIVVVSLLLLLLGQAASAQTYKVPGTRYSVWFPDAPRVEAPTTAKDGTGLRNFSADDGYASFTLTLFSTKRAMTEADVTRMSGIYRTCGDTSEVEHLKYSLNGVDYPAVVWSDDCSKIDMAFKTVMVAVGNDVVELRWFFNTSHLKKGDVEPAIEQMKYFISSLKMD